MPVSPIPLYQEARREPMQPPEHGRRLIFGALLYFAFWLVAYLFK